MEFIFSMLYDNKDVIRGSFTYVVMQPFPLSPLGQTAIFLMAQQEKMMPQLNYNRIFLLDQQFFISHLLYPQCI